MTKKLDGALHPTGALGAIVHVKYLLSQLQGASPDREDFEKSTQTHLLMQELRHAGHGKEYERRRMVLPKVEKIDATLKFSRSLKHRVYY